MNTKTTGLPCPYPQPPTTSTSLPARHKYQAPASLWTVVLPVVLTMLLTTFAAHAQQPPGARPTTTCEVCIPPEYRDACEEAAADAQTYHGEAKAMRRAHREAEERARREAVEAELARREAEAARERGWWMLAGGSAAGALLLVAVYAIAN